MDMNKIMELTVDEVIADAELNNLAQEAKEISKLIYDNYKCFGIGQSYIELLNDGYNAEYLTHFGQWHASYPWQDYIVTCTPNGIFKAMKVNYLYEKGVALKPNTLYMVEGYKYFMSFVKRLRKEVEMKQRETQGQ